MKVEKHACPPSACGALCDNDREHRPNCATQAKESRVWAGGQAQRPLVHEARNARTFACTRGSAVLAPHKSR